MLLHQSDLEYALRASNQVSGHIEKRLCAGGFVLLSALALALPDQSLTALCASLLLFILNCMLLFQQSRSVHPCSVRRNILSYAAMVPALLFLACSKHLAPGVQSLLILTFLLSCLLTCLLGLLLFCVPTHDNSLRWHRLSLLYASHFLSLSLFIICLLDAALMMLKQIHFA
ncbi:hypothetical protein [Undibacterium rugosum]|uniref:Uncharacterized protein n=1 Tax=Undibacterium rugosum TaxID=2762291 RepID=A0A923KTJ8_9BURK|nr:hypothetical protein [Undibacterium rugosum]MBC3936124.1 hypothetical protein [Undibacterium rugosum]MBR7779243.1 hypothetical protein [Undibacterium rugosum]